MKLQNLELQLSELRKMVFGSRQEQFISNAKPASQQQLFDVAAIATVEVEKTVLIKEHEKKTVKLKVNENHPGRQALPENLRREVITLSPAEDVAGLKPVRVEVTEQLEYLPGELFVKRYERPEYIKPSSDGLNAQRVIAEPPQAPLPKSIASGSLLTQLLVSKYVDHLPLYRQLDMFKRQQVNINHSTVSGWIKGAMALIEPVYNLHAKTVLATNYLCVDETTIKVQDKEKKGTTHRGFYWVYYDTQRRLALFDYQPGRGAKYPQAMLSGFKGYLQSDGYDEYETFDEVESVTTLCCWAHARRKYFEAKDYDPPNAEKILHQIQQLYEIEAHCREKNYSSEQIKAYRQQHAVPLLAALKITLEKTLIQSLPTSPLGKAISYTLKRWEKLNIYTTNGILQIDNNLVENSIRPVSLGRKNYLFAGSHERAQDAAMLYSLFSTCRLHNVNPEKWLTHLFENINQTKMTELHKLLPQNYENLAE